MDLHIHYRMVEMHGLDLQGLWQLVATDTDDATVDLESLDHSSIHYLQQSKFRSFLCQLAKNRFTPEDESACQDVCIYYSVCICQVVRQRH